MGDHSQGGIYTRVGIVDVAEFYLTKFVSDEVLDARYFAPLNRFDIRFARTMWVYDNVRAGSTVLDLGCGSGMLALLKRKGVTLVGVDLSAEAAMAVRRNGYDESFKAELTQLPFSDSSFDYVVSLDVLGHVEFGEKDRVLSEIKRVLKLDGVTMHGIECIDRSRQRDYSQMSDDELHRFVEVDGHVGLEEEHEHAARFARFFSHVAHEPRYGLCLSSEEILKQVDHYGMQVDQDFVDYLRGLSFKERRAFDMAMGYVFARVSDLDIKLPRIGLYVLLKASNSELGAFYNEHRDRSALTAHRSSNPSETCLDRDSAVVFDDGFYEPNVLPPVARWMRERGRIRFTTRSLSGIRLDLTTHYPDLGENPIGIEILLNGMRLAAFSLARYGWLDLLLPVEESMKSHEGLYELELRADRTWKPRPNDSSNRDDREISIAVCNVEVL
jgi:ubiquinone/menaquinone biosynthesis C-methylase UbiE